MLKIIILKLGAWKISNMHKSNAIGLFVDISTSHMQVLSLLIEFLVTFIRLPYAAITLDGNYRV